MPAVLTKVDDVLELDLSSARGFEFKDALNKVRSMKERGGVRFEFERKMWVFEASPAKAEEIISVIGPDCDESLRTWVIESKMKQEEDLLTPLPRDADVMVPWGFDRCHWQPEFVNDEKFVGLLDYQRSAVAHLVQAHRGILADDMGLGKTLEAISTIEEWRLRNRLADGGLPGGASLVVCPSSVMGSWARELNRWLEPDTYGVQLIDGGTLKARHKQLLYAINEGLWTIVNWEQLRVERRLRKVKHRSGLTSEERYTVMKEPLFQIPHTAWMEPSLDDMDYRLIENARKSADAHGWLAVIADEAHRAKNPRALQSKGLHRVFGNTMLAMTGTPIMNSPDEIWSLLRWLWPEQYTSYESFYNDYVDFYENPDFGGKVVTGVRNPEGLRFELKGRLVRRTQSQVRDSLPGRRRIYVPTTLLPYQQELYDTAERAIWLEVQQAATEGDKSAGKFAAALEAGATPASLYRLPNGAARMTRLRQIVETPATLGGEPVSANMDDFEERFEDSRPEPWLIFTEFKETAVVQAERLRDKFGARVAVYTGDTPKDERTQIEDDFQLGKLDAVVGTMAALKEGITLVRGHLQYWHGRFFVPDLNEQGEARQADRMGQQQKTIIYVPQANGTVAETKLPVILERKEGIVRTVVSKDKIEEVTASA